ncbi:tatD [Mytilus edulis]|uniref:TatD n=1 Tax=Mytilus edulis TaxID=6550 RepID=A0A8S3TAP0_MYTED|nr:tatD [Mytilus edulis]
MSEEELDYEEEENQDHLTEPKRQVAIRGEATNVRLRHRECDICFHTFTNPRRHTIQTHLPWYVAPETACWICGTQEQTANFLNKHITRCHPTNAIDATFKNREVMYAELMNGLLRELARALGTSFPVGLEEKLNAIMRIRTQLPPTEFHISEVKLVDSFLKLNCMEPPADYKIPATPLLEIYHILHWKILKNLIGYLNSDEQLWLLKFEERKNKEGLQIGQLSTKLSGPLHIIDSHFHLDQLCRQMGSGAFQDLDDLGSQSIYKTELKYAIANFVFPSAWPNSAQRSEFRKDNRLRFTFGIHPKIVSSSSTSSLEHNWTDLQNLLKSTKTVAVGEIGLDDSTNPSRRDFERQITYFRKQLYLAAELNLTVVIHSRGKPSLHEHVLATLSEICKPDQLIHWHCFTCTTQLYSAAVSQFSNIVFGITPFILKDRYSNIVEIVKTFGITRVVLESDAPYIPLHSHTIGNPYSVHAVALKISELLQQPIEDVFKITTENSKKIYKLQ